MNDALINSEIGILAILAGVAAFFFWLEHTSKWKLFNFFPPLLFIYAIPVVLSNTGFIAVKSPLYGWMSSLLLPLFLTLMLINVNIGSTIRVMGRGVFVMLFGTAGVVIGAPIAYFLFKSGFGPETWKGFGALAGSWIGGTGNLAAVSESLDTPGIAKSLAIVTDSAVYVIWLPIMLGSKNLARWFHRFTGVSDERLRKMKKAAEELKREKGKPEMRHLLYLFFLGLVVAWGATELGKILPEVQPILTSGTYKMLLITTFGIVLSFTPARDIPGSHTLAMALVYLFVAKMGASAEISGIAGMAGWFILAGYVWIFIHGGFCLLGARLFRVDVHTAAIASAANIGGAASAPVVAAYHDERLVPVSILMALIGYAVGNYAALGAAWLCYFVS